MDREARLSRRAALLALSLLAACVAPPRTGGIGSREFVPTGPVVSVWHIGLVGTGCEPPSGPLRIEGRVAESVLRVSNPTGAPIHFYYDSDTSFGDYQMFFIRFRDGAGNLQDVRDGGCGWWSPKENQANLYTPGEWPERPRLTIPARGHLDIPLDPAALADWWPYSHSEPATGPCMMQVRLFGYLRRRTWDSVSAETEWLPVPCPPVNPQLIRVPE